MKPHPLLRSLVYGLDRLAWRLAATSLLAAVLATPASAQPASSNHRNKRNVTTTYVPKLEYHRGDLTLTAGGGYSRSGTHYEDLRQGYFQSVNLRLTRMSWMAERKDTNATDWTVTQLSGRPWGGTQNWTFVGPRNSQTDPTTVMIDESQHPFDPKRGGNVTQQNFPWPDTNAMASYFVAHPEEFVPNAVTNFTNAFTTPRSVKEQIAAAYLEGNSRWRQVRFNLGARFERTRTIGRTYDILPAAAVRAAGYTAGTIPYVAYQYRNGARPSTYGGYDNMFFSASLL